MSELATAYVQLVPTATGMQGKIAKELGGEANAAGKAAGDQAGQSMGASLGGAFKKVVVALGLGKIVKDALTAGGDLQQSFGGLDTLYGDAADAAKKYSAEAVKAGIASNDYAEQAVSFGAALKQAYGGDTYKAMEAANTAILDIADNSAKMGTDINSVQNAYQGFAKQNYTMLDNLKLGYGGTKSEMERLLADAEKLSGVKYNIDNLGDVYSAIHVIQEDLGLTGVAAKEASETFTGSLASMKAAATNLLANLALGEDLDPALVALSSSVRNFVENNLLPMVGNIGQALPQIVNQILGELASIFATINYEADIPGLLDAGVGILKGILDGIIAWTPFVLGQLVEVLSSIGEAFISYDWGSVASDLLATFTETMEEFAPEWLGTDAAGIIPAIIQGITSTISDLLAQANVILKEFSSAITAALPTLLSAGVEILTEIINGILEAIPELIIAAGDILNTLLDAILSQLPMLLEAGVNILLSITEGILNNLPQIVTAAAQIMMQLQTTLIQHYPEILQKGFELLGKLATGIIKAYPQVIKAMFDLLKQLAAEVTKVNWLELGVNIVKGIANGIKSAAGEIWNALKSAVSSAWNNTKEFLGINSPSKLAENEIGKMLPRGIAVGIKEDAGYVTKAMHEIAVESVNVSQSIPYIGNVQTEGTTASINIVNNFTINGTNKDGQELAEETSYYLAEEQAKIAGVFA